jgi:hypothetical protein
MPQTLRLSTKARAAAEHLADLAGRIHDDQTITPAELASFREAMRDVIELTAHVDDSLNLAMVLMKGGATSRRFREVARDYERTHGAVIDMAHERKHRRPGMDNGAA